MPYHIDVAYVRVRELNEVVEVVVTDHGMPQQIAWFNFVRNPSEPIDHDAKYEVIFRRKDISNGERKETP